MTYEYQFYVIHKGTRYTSPWMTFSTTGSCSHSWADQGVQEVATALSEGTMIQGCTKCGATSSRSIPKLTPTLILNASSITLKSGDVFQVKVSGMAEGDYPTQISSSNGNAALVNEYGMILGKNAPGTSIVTITLASGLTGQIRVNVVAAAGSSGGAASSAEGSASGSGSSGIQAGAATAAAKSTAGTGPDLTVRVTNIKVTGKNKVTVGKKITLKAAVTVSGNASKKVKWTSSKPSVAKVSSGGTVTGIKPGIAEIRAVSTDGNKVTGKLIVYVVPKKVSSFRVKALSGRYIKATWKKPGKLSGYQIQYSRSAKFKKGKTIRVKAGKKSLRFRVPLKKKYYVRIRSYVKVGSKVLYSQWSKKKTVKIRK